MSTKNIVLISFLFALSLILTFTIYNVGIHGYFLLDDAVNLSRVNDYGGATQSLNSLMNYLFSTGSVLSGRPVSFLSFLINDNAWPTDPTLFKLTNIYIHLLTTILIFILARQILNYSNFSAFQKNITALIAMSLWACHPLNVSTVLYVVQRMAELSTFFSIMAIIFYIKGRENYIQNKTPRQLLFLSITVLPLIGLSFLSKENGVVSLLFVIIVEYTLFQNKKMSFELKGWFALFIITPVIIIFVYLIFFKNHSDIYIYRGHSITEHLLTEARVLVDYLGQLFSPNISRMGVIHDDFPVSRSLTKPITTLYSILVIISLFIFAFLLKKKYPIITLGILWFFAGHSLESSFLPLELYFEHRNYMASIGLTIAFSFIIITAIEAISKKSLKSLATLSAIFIFCVLVFQTFSLSRVWSNTPLQMAIAYNKHPTSIRAAHHHALYLVSKRDESQAISIYHKLYKQTENLNSLLLYLKSYCDYHKTLPYENNIILQESAKLHPIGANNISLKMLSESILKHQCVSKPVMFLDHLYTAIENNIYLKYRKDDLARIYYTHADIIHALGDLERSLQMLDNAFKIQPTTDIALRQVALLLVKKKYTQSLIYVDKATQANKNRKLLKPDRSTEINIQKQYILSQINASS